MNSKTEGQKPREPELNEYVRGVGTLVAVELRTPPPPQTYTDYIFEEITARTELRMGGETLQEMSTLWDFYGKNTSVQTAIKEAKAYAAKKDIGPDSELEVVVVKIVSQVRKRIKDRENFYDKRFINFEAPDVGCKLDLPEDVETIAWSSRNAPSVGDGNKEQGAPLIPKTEI